MALCAPDNALAMVAGDEDVMAILTILGITTINQLARQDCQELSKGVETVLDKFGVSERAKFATVFRVMDARQVVLHNVDHGATPSQMSRLQLYQVTRDCSVTSPVLDLGTVDTLQLAVVDAVDKLECKG